MSGGGSYSSIFPPVSREPTKNEEKKTAQKTYTTSTKYGSSVDFSAPQIATGKTIPYLLGRHLCTDPLLLWYGNVSPTYDLSINQTSQTDDDGNTTVNTEYTYTPNGYKADYQFALALGPDVDLNAIYYKGVLVWSGELGSGRHEFEVTASAAPLGECVFQSGQFDQVPDPYLEPLLNPDGDTPSPGFVGIAYIIVKGVKTDELGNIAFEISRYPDVLGLGGNNKIGVDLNVISAIADIITNPWGACGQPTELLDVANLTAAANIEYNRADGCSLINKSPVSGTTLLTTLMLQCRGSLFINPETNQYQIKLKSFPPDKAGALRIYDNDIIDISTMEKPSWQSVPANLSISFTDRSQRYEDNSVLGKNLASDTSNNSTVDVSIPTILNKVLATSVLARETAIQSSPMQQMDLLVNRKAAAALPGDVVVFTMSKYQYYSVAFVVERRRTQPLDLNNVTLSGYVVLYPNNNSLFAVPEDSLFEPYDFTPYPPDNVDIVDLPFFWNWDRLDYLNIGPFYDLYPPKGSYALYVADRHNKNQYQYNAVHPNGLAAWKLPFSDGVSGSPSATVVGAPYPTLGTLHNAIDIYDAWGGGAITLTIDVSDYSDNSDASVNSSGDAIPNAAYPRGYVFVDNEIFIFDVTAFGSVWTYTKSSKQLEITNCYRACIDTVAESHPVGATAFVMFPGIDLAYSRMNKGIPAGNNLPDDFNFYGYALAFGALKRSDTAFVIGAAEYTATNRYKRPYRPHNTKINGARSSTPVELSESDEIDVTWIPRSRIRNSISTGLYRQVPDGPYRQTDANAVAGTLAERDADGFATSYRVWMEDSDGTTYDLGLAATGTSPATSKTVTVPAMALGDGWLWVDAEFNQYTDVAESGTERLISQFKDRLPITIVA